VQKLQEFQGFQGYDGRFALMIPKYGDSSCGSFRDVLFAIVLTHIYIEHIESALTRSYKHMILYHAYESNIYFLEIPLYLIDFHIEATTTCFDSLLELRHRECLEARQPDSIM
jgi:hypothetical protein